MSNISSKRIYFTNDIKCEIKGNDRRSFLWVSGGYGTWFYILPRFKYNLNLFDHQIRIKCSRFFNVMKHYHLCLHRYAMPVLASQMSLASVLVRRMIVGAGVGFKKYLRVRGVGYKFELQNLLLQAKVGYNHNIKKRLPSEFYTKLSRKFKVIRFRSKSLTTVTGFVSAMRCMRRPDVYKGKGIRYKRDPAIRKVGKNANKGLTKKKKI